MGLFYLKVSCSIVKWENVLAFTNLTLYSNCNNGPVFFSLLHRSSCYNFFSHFLASLGNWIKDCPMVWSLFSERSLAVFKAGLLFAVWVNWTWKKQSPFKLQKQNCCDREEGPLQKILKIIWQGRSLTRRSKGSMCCLWPFTSLISCARLYFDTLMTIDEVGKGLCIYASAVYSY